MNIACCDVAWSVISTCLVTVGFKVLNELGRWVNLIIKIYINTASFYFYFLGISHMSAHWKIIYSFLPSIDTTQKHLNSHLEMLCSACCFTDGGAFNLELMPFRARSSKVRSKCSETRLVHYSSKCKIINHSFCLEAWGSQPVTLHRQEKRYEK